MPSASLSQRLPAYAMASTALAVAAIAGAAAVSWYEHPIAGLLVDPNGVVSGIGLSQWSGKRRGLGFPDRIMAVDGVPLNALGTLQRGRAWDRAVEDAYAAGRTKVAVQVQKKEGTVQATLEVHKLDPLAWWAFAASLFFAGALYVGAGLIAIWASPRGRLARTFAKFSVLAGLYMFTVFDFHSTGVLVPVLFLSFALLPGAWIMLGLRLPDDVPLLKRWPALELLTDLAGLAVGLSFLGLHLTGSSTTQLQVLWSPVFGGSMIAFACVFCVRFLRAKGPRRAVLRALLVALVPPFALTGGLIILSALGSTKSAFTLAFPSLSLGPLAIGYAFIRHDLWGSRALLSRAVTQVVLCVIVCALAVSFGAACATWLHVELKGALIAATLAAVSAAVLVTLTLRLAERVFFPSRAKYKPTVEQLSEELMSIDSPDQVVQAIERTVRRWLPCEMVEVSLGPEPRQASASAPAANPKANPAPMACGEEKQNDEAAAKPSAGEEKPKRGAGLSGAEDNNEQIPGVELSLPIDFAGRRLGQLMVGGKSGGALFTGDDVDLLNTIVNQGALAWAYANAYRELEERRKQQAQAWRGERVSLIGTVAAEIAHEVRYSINFFRSVFAKSSREKPLEEEDIDIGQEEVDRLERMVSGLRRVTAHQLERRPVSLAELCARAEVLLRDRLGTRQIETDVDKNISLRCDADKVTQVLVNLLSNALDATEDGDHIGVEWVCQDAKTSLRVWDSGPGFVCEPSRLFAPWFTTKERGTGLGLAITHRLVRAHGWTIQAARQDDLTVFDIQVRPEDVVAADKAAFFRPLRPP